VRFRGTIVVVGDLHMAAGDRDPFREDAAFAAFLAAQARRRDAAGRPLRLVILGDLFDFPGTPLRGSPAPDASEAGALRRLERIARAHGTVIEALAGFAAGGGAVDVVAGNHDAELAHPGVQARVRELLGDPPRLVFHPWILFVPGVLYAEHGHQHHDVDAFATPLEPWRRDAPGELDLPPGSLLSYRIAADGRAAGVHRRAADGALLVRGAVRPRGDATTLRAYRDGPLRRLADDLDLPAEVLRAIDAATPRGPAALVARVARRATEAGRHPSATAHRAALTIHRALGAAHCAVPFYAFGHSHVAQRRPLVEGMGTPVYLNAGTWSSLGRRVQPQPLAYVEISGGPAGPLGRLMHWSGEGRAVTGTAGSRPRRAADPSGRALAPRSP
jgi:UDP-2,3-diacylglucosamine pyrophosphatase LpxH